MRNVGPSGGAGRGPLPVCGAAEGGSSQGLLEPEPHLSLHPLLAGTPAASSAHPQGPACPHLREGAACAGGRNSGSPASPRQAEGLTPGPPASLLPPPTQGHCSGTGGAEDSTSGGGPGPGFRALSSPLRGSGTQRGEQKAMHHKALSRTFISSFTSGQSAKITTVHGVLSWARLV